MPDLEKLFNEIEEDVARLEVNTKSLKKDVAKQDKSEVIEVDDDSQVANFFIKLVFFAVTAARLWPSLQSNVLLLNTFIDVLFSWLIFMLMVLHLLSATSFQLACVLQNKEKNVNAFYCLKYLTRYYFATPSWSASANYVFVTFIIDFGRHPCGTLEIGKMYAARHQSATGMRKIQCFMCVSPTWISEAATFFFQLCFFLGSWVC